MSSAFALQLPKFDSEPGLVIGDRDDPVDEPFDDVDALPAFEDGFPPMDLVEEEPLPEIEDVPLTLETFVEEDHWEPSPEFQNSDVDITEKLESVEKLVTELTSTAQLLEGQMADRIEQKIQAIASALFPKLAEDFLAEEISRFLAYAVPQNQSQIEITVPGPIEADLTECLLRVKSLHGRWTITASPQGSEPSVHVNWGDGGFDYDLSTLLAACHAHNFQNGTGLED